MIITSPTARRNIYAVATALLALAGAYGLVRPDLMPAWVGLIAAITGLATVNTTPASPPE